VLLVFYSGLLIDDGAAGATATAMIGPPISHDPRRPAPQQQQAPGPYVVHQQQAPPPPSPYVVPQQQQQQQQGGYVVPQQQPPQHELYDPVSAGYAPVPAPVAYPAPAPVAYPAAPPSAAAAPIPRFQLQRPPVQPQEYYDQPVHVQHGHMPPPPVALVNQPLPPVEQQAPSRRLFIGGLPINITSRQLTSYFTQFGEVDSAEVIGKRGFGFVSFVSLGAAQRAMSHPSHTIEDHKVTTTIVYNIITTILECRAQMGRFQGGHAKAQHVDCSSYQRPQRRPPDPPARSPLHPDTAQRLPL